MGKHRYAGAHEKTFESLPADSALAATVTRIFLARLVSYRSGLCFSPRGESGDTRALLNRDKSVAGEEVR
jgi:hypothetical protein